MSSGGVGRHLREAHARDSYEGGADDGSSDDQYVGRPMSHTYMLYATSIVFCLSKGHVSA